MKLKVDKLVAVGGSGLLGYYMSISIFRGVFWRWLVAVLPPINDRNLPGNYVGLLGFVIAAAICYIAYTWFVERRAVAKNKRQYFCGIAALVLLPALLLFTFRVHAAGFVRGAEATTPTDLSIRYQEKSTGFWLTDSSAVVYGRSVEIHRDDTYLSPLGKGLQRMEIARIITGGANDIGQHEATLWINYDYKGHWYSKIISKHNEGFLESVGNGRQLLYKGEELEGFLDELDSQLASMKDFTEARIYHGSLLEGNEFKGIEAVSEEKLRLLKANIIEENKQQPGPDIAAAFDALIKERNYIDRNQIHLYVIALRRELKDNTRQLTLDNFILYDSDQQLAWFEGEYYSVDLNEVVAFDK